MKFPSKEIVERVRAEYPDGTRVELVRMDDSQAPPIGTKGTVYGVDDTGSIMVKWDNGSSLHVVYGEDECKKVDWPSVPDDVLEKAIATQEEFIRRYKAKYNSDPEFDLIIWAIMQELKERKAKERSNTNDG